MEDTETIVSGPEFSDPEIQGSVAEYLIPKLKAQAKDFIFQVDCATGETITSQEFLRQSLEVAEGLIEFGLELEDVVVFACSNNIPSHIAAIGVILSGGVFAPIDQTLRTFELQHLFKQFQPKFIICEKVKGREIQECVKSIHLDAKIIIIDSAEPNGEFFSFGDIRTKVDVDSYVPRKVVDPKKNIVIISCSSGSTGMPKGVAISHYSILFYFSLMENLLSSTQNQNLLLTSPFFWISGTIILINSCYFGQPCYIPKSIASEDLLPAIEKSKKGLGVVCLGVSALLTSRRIADGILPFLLLLAPSNLLSLVANPNFKNYDVSSVKIIFSTGAMLNQKMVAKVKQVWKDITISNCYGLTEACGGIIINSGFKDADAVGKLLPEVTVKVVDVNTGKSLGPNKVGECRIKTKRLMNGYYNNEEATKAAFDEKGWLRTGDLIYYDDEGIFHVVGRMKQVIDYQNYKISPAEIEAFIMSLAGVKDVAIVPVPHEADTNRLRALVVKDAKFDISAEDIIQAVEKNFTERKHLKEGVQFVEALPRSEVGKLRYAEAQKMIHVKST